MRINSFKSGSKTHPLLLHWADLFADEFQISSKIGLKYVIHSPELVSGFLENQGWKVTAYQLPPLPEGVELEYETPIVRSQGYILAEDCEKYVEFRLRQE